MSLGQWRAASREVEELAQGHPGRWWPQPGHRLVPLASESQTPGAPIPGWQRTPGMKSEGIATYLPHTGVGFLYFKM